MVGAARTAFSEKPRMSFEQMEAQLEKEIDWSGQHLHKSPPQLKTISTAKKQWLSQFKESFVLGMCEQTTLLKQCYEVSADVCKKDIHLFFPQCSQQMSIPARVQETESVRLGAELGRCLGTQLHREHRAQMRNIPNCKDPFQWL